MADLWIIYSSKHDFMLGPENQACKMNQAAIDAGIDSELKFAEYFEFKENKVYYKEAIEENLPKMVFLRCNYIDLAKSFEALGIRAVNSSYAITNATDKALAHNLVSSLNIPQIKGEICDNLDYEYIVNKYGKPFILKDRFGLQGKNIYLVKSKLKYNILKKRKNLSTYLVQEYIKYSRGKDVRLYFCGDECIGAVKRQNKHGLVSNINGGGLAYDFKASDGLISNGRLIKNAIKGDIISVDFVFKNDDEFLFCEANTNAGFKSYTFLGYDMRSHFMTYLKNELK